MASSNPHKFVPSHFVKAAQRKLNQTGMSSADKTCSNHSTHANTSSRYTNEMNNRHKTPYMRGYQKHQMPYVLPSFPFRNPNHIGYRAPVDCRMYHAGHYNRHARPVSMQYSTSFLGNPESSTRFSQRASSSVSSHDSHKWKNGAYIHPNDAVRQCEHDGGVSSSSTMSHDSFNARHLVNHNQRLITSTSGRSMNNDNLGSHLGHSRHKSLALDIECSKAKDSNKRISGQSEKIKRTWITSTSKISQNNSLDCGTCSVMSYNILSQTLLELNNNLYKDCDPDILPWSFRWNNLRKEMDNFKADVLCLQEVEECDYYNDIKPWLTSSGYYHAYKRRTGNERNKPDGVLTACRSNKFKIKKVVPVEYFRRNGHLTNRHNVGLILVLQMLTSDTSIPSTICIGNTHLLYNPRRGDIKLIQLATFFAELKHVLHEQTLVTGSQPPLVVCGDFNSTPDSHLYDFVTSGFFNFEGIIPKFISGQKSSGGHTGKECMPANILPSYLNINKQCTFYEAGNDEIHDETSVLQHSLGHLSSSGDQHLAYEATTMQNHGITVDYIFYSNNDKSETSNAAALKYKARTDFTEDVACVNFNKPCEENLQACSSSSKKLTLELKRHLSLCTGQVIKCANGLPNSNHSSDHLPVVAEFAVKLA